MDTLPSGELQSGGFRSALAVSGFRLRARLGFSIPSSLPGQRGITPAFGYGAPHSSARGTSTLLNNALLSAHYAAAPTPRHSRVRLLGSSPSLPALPLSARATAGPPGSRAWSFHACHGVLRLRGSVVRILAFIGAHRSCCLPPRLTASASLVRLSRTQYPACMCPCQRFNVHRLRGPPHDSGSGRFATPFPVVLFHSLLHAGFPSALSALPLRPLRLRVELSASPTLGDTSRSAPSTGASAKVEGAQKL